MPVWIASVFIVTVMNAPTASTNRKIIAEPYSTPVSSALTKPRSFSMPYRPFGVAIHSCFRRWSNEVSTHSSSPSASEHDGSSWSVPGTGRPVFGSMS